MKIVTLNTWGTYGPYEKRFPLIISELQRIKADIVCLQEVFDTNLKDKIKTTCNFSYSHECHPAGLVILSTLPIEKKETYRYKTISPNETNDRRVIFTKVRSRALLLWIGNTHLSWKEADAETRFEQVNELLGCAKKLGGEIILTGDFNCTPDSKPIRKLKAASFIDIFEKLHPNENGFTWDNDRNPFLKTHSVLFPNRRIDLMLANKHFLRNSQPKTCELAFTQSTNAIFPSDHFGLLAEFSQNAS